MPTNPGPVRWAEAGGYAVALAGLMALIAIALAPGTPYVLAMAVMGFGLAPVMVGFYELGGRAPQSPARASVVIAITAIVLWTAIMLSVAAGLVTFDESRGATGAYALLSVTMIIFGAVLAGATTLAGSWLSPVPRWLGVVCGIGWALVGIGSVLGGAEHPLTYLGAIGYQLLFPFWGLLIGRSFAGVRSGRRSVAA